MKNSNESPSVARGNFLSVALMRCLTVLVHSLPTVLVVLAIWAIYAADGPRKGAAFMPLVLGGFLLFWQLRWLWQWYKNRQQVYGV